MPLPHASLFVFRSPGSDYQEQIDIIRIPIPEKALYLSAEESRYPPICYTNYEPHFNPQQQLSAIIVGNHTGWNPVRKIGAWTDGGEMLGYKDIRPFYEVCRDHSLIGYLLGL